MLYSNIGQKVDRMADYNNLGLDDLDLEDNGFQAPNARAPKPENLPLPSIGTGSEEIAVGTVKLIDDGVVIRKSLTGFEQANTYLGVAPEERFSDHALILYPSQGIGTFNIAIRASKTKIPGTTSYNHKFPMDTANPLDETPEMYTKRLQNILNLCKTELDKGSISAIVFQEANLVAIDAVYRTAGLGRKSYGLLKNYEFCIFFKLDTAGNFKSEPLLIPDDFTNNTGMKGSKATLKETLKEKIVVYKNEAKKQLLFNVHIPGLDLVTGPVQKRRTNTLKLLTNIRALYAAKPEYSTYTAFFVGDFNVPLIGATQENSNAYEAIQVPMEIHTTPKNEGFSYIDNKRTRTPGNIDCLVKMPLTGGGATNEENSDAESINTETRARNEGPEENAEEKEAEEEVLEPVAADTNLPTILRIGNGGKFDEFINVAEKTFTSTGSFAILHKGGQKELQELYNVHDENRLTVLQKAFGVRRLSDKPPLMAAINEGCTPQYSTDVVDQALESRITTLKAELAQMKETTQKGMKRAFLKVLQNLLDAVRGLPEDNPCPPPAAPENIERNQESRTQAPAGCPCLENLDLLQDLVVLVATLLGIASPEVKEQLENIQLDTLLELVKDGKQKEATVQLRQVIQTLGELKNVTEPKEAGEEGGIASPGLQSVLTQIWRVLTDEAVPDNLTLDSLLAKLGQVLNTANQTVATTKSAKEALLRQIQRLEAEGEDLQRQLDECHAGEATAEQLAAARAELVNKEAALTAAEARITQLTQAITQATTAEERKDQAQADALADLRAQLTTAEAARRAAQDKVTRLEGELTESRAQTGAVTAERNAALAQQAELQAKVASLEKANKALTDILRERDNDLAKLGEEKAALEESIATGEANIKKQLDDKNAEIEAAQKAKADCEAALAAAQAELAAAQETLEQKDAEIADLTKRATNAESSSAAEKTKSESAAAQIRTLQANLAEVEARLEELNKSLAEKQATLDAQIQEYEQKATELAGQKPALEAEIESLKAAAADALSNASTAEAKVAELTVKLSTAENGLAAAKAEHEKEKEAHDKQLQDLNAKIAALHEAAEKAAKELEAFGKERTDKNSQFANLTAQIEALTAEKLALEAKGGEQAAALAAAKAEFEKQIKECQDKLSKLGQEKNAALAAKNTELANQKAEYDKAITELKAQIATAETKIQEASNTASGQIAAAQRASNEQRNRNVAAAKAEANAVKKKAEEEIEAVTSGAAAKNAEIADLKRQLAEAEAGKKSCEDELKKEKEKTEKFLAELPAQVAAKASVQESIKDLELRKQAAAHAAEDAAKVAQIRQLEQLLDQLNQQIQDLQIPSPDAQTETKLNTLLGVILVDEDLQKAAKAYMKSGDIKNLNTIKAKTTDIGIVSPELCEFFTYLYGVVRLQNKQLLQNLRNVDKSIQSNIFTAYKHINPSLPLQNIDDKDYLTEFSTFLQLFFGNFDGRIGVGASLPIDKEFPNIYSFITTRELKEDGNKPKLVAVLPTLGLLSNLYIIPTDPKNLPNKVTITSKEPKGDQRGIMFTVFAIKYIQVVYEFIREKSESLLAKCAPPTAATAPPTEEQKGGSEEIDFEEFTL